MFRTVSICVAAVFVSLLAGGVLAGTPVPTNVSPPDGAIDVPAQPTLCVDVLDPGGQPLDVTFHARELTAVPEGDFTVIILPDTQYYAQTYPEIFHEQVDWILDNLGPLNIAFVTHVGDIVQLAAAEAEWIVTDAALSKLEDPLRTGLPDGVPYGLSVGNHDQTPNNQAGTILDEDATTANYNTWFDVSRFQGRAYFGGHFNMSNDNNYQFFSAGGMDFVIVHLEFDEVDQELRDLQIQWSDDVISAYPDHRALLTTHSLLCTGVDGPNGTHCPQTLDAPWSDQGQLIYEQLKDNETVGLMICGHSSSALVQPRRTDSYQGHTIHTILANYQRLQPCPFRCGRGWLRILTFSPANDELRFETYSPWLDEFWTGVNPDHHTFTLPYDMNAGRHFAEIGTVGAVPSGMSACLPWSGRQDGAQYEWYAEVSDGAATAEGPRWTFTSSSSCAVPADCDDGDACTADDCVGSVCTNAPIANCCVTVEDCDDGNPCTDDACGAGNCSNTPNTEPCWDGDECTLGDTCAAGVCSGTPQSCDDGNACTIDSCADGACSSLYSPVGSCCTGDPDCDDGDTCTIDACVAGVCKNMAMADCCNVGLDCDDADSCTADVCLPRNESALRLDQLYAHATMQTQMAFNTDAITEPLGLNARTFTLELWFQWDGGGVPAKTSGWIYDPLDVGGIEAYPLIAKGINDQERSPNNPPAADKKSVNYFFGILEPGHFLAADMEEHSSGTSPALNHPVTGSTVIQPGVWYHAAATYDGGCWQLYLDGQPETDGTNCPNEPAAFESEHFFAVGIGQGSEGLIEGSFLGLIDEVRVWDRALSQAEIQANMFVQITGHPDLLGRWGFNEGAGVDVADSTGNGNFGSVFLAGFETGDVVGMGGGSCDIRQPGEVPVLELSRWPLTTLRWWETGSGFPYDLASGLLSDLRAGGGTSSAHVCLADDLFGTRVDDGRNPPSGDGFYYILREDGPCDDGSYGLTSAGAERDAPAACP